MAEQWVGHGVCVCVMLYFLILVVDSWVHSFRFQSLFCVYMIFYLDVYL